MDHEQTVTGGAPDPSEQFERAIDDFNRDLSDALKQGTTPRPDPAAYLDRVPADTRRRLFHELQKSRLFLVVRNTGEELRVEEVARAYNPPATDDELLELIHQEADARVLPERRENPESIRADLRLRFSRFAPRLSGTFLGDIRETQRETGPPNPPNYTIERRIGGGGQANVWLARHTGTGMYAALKVFRLQPPLGHPANDALRREAERLRGLRHRHIVRVNDCFEHAGYAYLVVEYIPGDTLGSRYKASPWPLVKALEMTADLADAVQFAHAAGVFHLDLKPANVMLTRNAAGHDAGAPRVEEDTPQIVDWGMYRVSGPDGRSSPYGTPAYMAPEQARGEDPDCRTDVWGLGGILYHLLLCRPLYDEPNGIAALERARNRHDFPRPCERDKNIPLDVEACLLKALNPDRAERYSSAAALATELRELIARHRDRVAPPPPPPERVTAFVRLQSRYGCWIQVGISLCVLAMCVLAATAFYHLARPDEARESKGSPDAKRDDTGPGTSHAAPPVAAPADAPLEVDVRGVAYSAVNPKQPLRLTDGIELMSRDQFRLHVRAERECHVYVVNVDSRGQVELLCPRPDVQASSRLAAGREVWLPGEAAGGKNLWYTLDDNPGTDWIYLVASKSPVKALESLGNGPEPGGGVNRVPAVLDNLLSQYRGVEVQAAAVAPIGERDDPQVKWERVRARAAEPSPELVVKGWRIVHRPRP